MSEARFGNFVAEISRINSDIQKLKGRFSGYTGLKSVHILWIYLLFIRPDGMTASELAAEGRINRSLVSREINELLDKGIVETAASAGRRRYASKLRLTQEGIAAAKRIAGFAQQVQDSVGRDISPEELAIFYKTLHVIADQMDLATQLENFEVPSNKESE